MRAPKPKQLAVSLYQALLDSPASQQAITKSFVKLLARRRWLKLAPRIVQAFSDYHDEHEGIVAVTLTTARPVGERQAVVEALKKTLQKEIRLTTRVNAGLIGGAVIQYADRRFDASVKGALNQLKQRLAH